MGVQRNHADVGQVPVAELLRLRRQLQEHGIETAN